MLKIRNNSSENEVKILILEPFYGGSHKVLIDTLINNGLKNYKLVTLPAKKWHWRARCGALIMSQLIPNIINPKVLFCSSVLSLTELLGLRPELCCSKKIVYFHENQLVYPTQVIKKRDYQYCYNQLTTCLSADLILFNSNYNLSSFLDNINRIIKILPDFRPKNLQLMIKKKCQILYFPIEFPINTNKPNNSILHILWPHRWEFDKNPEDFFHILYRLKEKQYKFKVSVLGESYTTNPSIFNEAKSNLKDEIIHFGYLENKNDYYEILNSSHVVVSTAKHEFFGAAMLESTYCGCFPLAPNALVYPEIYPKECLFFNLDELFCMLQDFCNFPTKAIEKRNKLNIDFEKYSSSTLIPQYMDYFV